MLHLPVSPARIKLWPSPCSVIPPVCHRRSGFEGYKEACACIVALLVTFYVTVGRVRIDLKHRPLESAWRILVRIECGECSHKGVGDEVVSAA